MREARLSEFELPRIGVAPPRASRVDPLRVLMGVS